MQVIIYNVCSVSRALRLTEILQLLVAGVLILTGIEFKRPPLVSVPYHMVKLESYLGLVWGWQRDALRNRSVGVRIFLREQCFRLQNITRLWSPELWLQGLGGVVRLLSSCYDFAVVATYPPPIADGFEKVQIKAAERTARWECSRLGRQF